MTDLIKKAKSHSLALYLDGKDIETQRTLNALIDYAEELQAALENLINAADGITPSDEEFMDEQMAIDADDWDDWLTIVDEVKKVLAND